jgi:hypothetical protein
MRLGIERGMIPTMKKLKSSKAKGSKVPRNSKTGEFTIGRDRFAKISAVEGIALTKQMRMRSAEFDKMGMSAEERRSAIIRSYRKS